MINTIGNHYGVYNRAVLSNFQRGAVPAVSEAKKVNNQAVQETSASTQQLSKDLTNFLHDYRDQFHDLKNAAEQLDTSVSGSLGTVTEASIANKDIISMPMNGSPQQNSGSFVKSDKDFQAVRSSVENLVNTYNQTVQFIRDNGVKNSTTTDQLKNLLPVGISDQEMESIGLAYSDNGMLNFQSDVFDNSYRQDSKQVQDLLSGTHSIANSLESTCDKALAQPSNSFVRAGQVNWDLNNLQNQQHKNGNSVPMGVYSRNGSCNFMNSAAMGMFLNVKA